MKITHSKSFSPITFAITCESQAEIDALCGIFNTSLIMEPVRSAYGVPDFKPYMGIQDIKLNQGTHELNELLRSKRY